MHAAQARYVQATPRLSDFAKSDARRRITDSAQICPKKNIRNYNKLICNFYHVLSVATAACNSLIAHG